MEVRRESASAVPSSDGRILSWRRLLLTVVPGLGAAAVAVFAGAPQLSALVGWTVAAAGLLIWVWRISWPQDQSGTKRLAEEEGSTHVTDTVVLSAAVASLAAVAVALVQADSKTAVGTSAVVLGPVAVILSWALVNTVFALKYARLYYSGRDGGIDFHDDRPPAYADFAYVAFCVGMTFAVSETAPDTTETRKAALRHGLLSFLFVTVAIAVSVNLVTNLH